MPATPTSPLPPGGFASSYTQARNAWLAAAAAAGARLATWQHPLAGPEGEALALDVAHFGDPEAETALVLVCGTHGIEGYAGSAVLTAWLRAGGPGELAPGLAVLMVHALNPWGFAHGQRGTENNVDLNRNFLTFPAVPSPNLGYAELHPELMLPHWDEPAIASAFAAMDRFRERVGEKAFSDAFNGGQYLRPDGIFYGGLAPEWSNLALRELLPQQLPAARRCALVDLHTGIGPYGQPFFINFDPPGSFGREAARLLWGDEALSGKGSTHAAFATFQGVMIDAFAASLPGCEVSAVAVEFGTHERRRMQRAHLTLAWLRRQTQDSEATRAARAEYEDAFIPRDPAWRESVRERGVALCMHGLARLRALHGGAIAWPD